MADLNSDKTDKVRHQEAGIDLDKIELEERQCVLVVDDDPDTVYLLKQVLRTGGFNVLGAVNGEEALQKITRFQPNLVLLDVMMPDMDGYEVFKNIREMSTVPVILITAMSTRENVVEGLRKGVDDYISKPFYNPEVLERVRTVLRRSSSQANLERLSFPKIGLMIDLTTQEVVLNGENLHLTPKEFTFFTLLAKNAPAVVKYSTIATEVWDEHTSNIRKRTNYMVYLLRLKFNEVAPDIDLINNVDRVGYKLQVEPV